MDSLLALSCFFIIQVQALQRRQDRGAVPALFSENTIFCRALMHIRTSLVAAMLAITKHGVCVC